MKYFCGIDTGGTFTDCAVIDETGSITIAKRPSTPEDYSAGLFDALQACADRIGIRLETLLENTEHFFLGTTVGTNALLQMKGAKTGLITTRGHKDCLAIMRSAGRSAGLPGPAAKFVGVFIVVFNPMRYQYPQFVLLIHFLPPVPTTTQASPDV